MDIRPNSEGISTAESNEQQRNWSDSQWQEKAKGGVATYDISRRHLNFEVARGGVVQPIDTSKTIMQKLNDSLSSRGIHNPNARENVRRPQRILAQFILSGSHDRMMELAFGSQEVLPKGKDNSSLHREKDIERWAKDVYGFLARHFGEENIISFYVHLDERSPHVHCAVVPVNKDNKVSWRDVFGAQLDDGRQMFTHLHDMLEREVNSKWGLARGSNIKETGAKHISVDDYRRNMVNVVQGLEHSVAGLKEQIRRAEIKLKGVSTMIDNLQNRKEKIEEEIELLAKKFGEEGVDIADLAERMRKLRLEKDEIDSVLAKRYKQLKDAENAISAAKEKLSQLEQKNRNLNDVVADKIGIKAKKVESGIAKAYNRILTESLKPIIPSLPEKTGEILDDSGVLNLIENMQKILNCAKLLAINYIEEATTYAKSFGGSTTNMSGWGRNKDDDDDRWWLRCIVKAASMMKSSGRSVGRRR